MSTMRLTLLTDLYELTMMQGYFKNQTNETVVFDVFYRKNPSGSGFAIAAGLDQVIDYIKNLTFEPGDIEYLRSLKLFDEDFLEYLSNFRFSGDIYAIPEGTVVFPREPLLKVIAPIMEAQLVETAILTIVNHQSLIATKSARVVYAAKGDGIMEFGLRRAQGPDAGIYGARAAMIGGCIGTSNVLAGQLFDVPVKGTHAHSWIMSFPDEYTAFKKYSELYPDVTSWGVGTNMITSSDCPAFGGVYKLAAVLDEEGEFVPKIKLSENTEKITNPGNKTIFRIYDNETGKIRADLIALADETFDCSQDLLIFDSIETWKKTKLKGGTYHMRELLVPVFQKGECVYTSPSVMEIRDYCAQEQDTLWDETRRLTNPHEVYVDLSDKLFRIKSGLLDQMSQEL